MIKNHLIILSIFTIFLISCGPTQQAIECNEFKKGKFIMKSKVDNSYFIINRNDSTQTETNNKTGQITTAKIEWAGPCFYKLYYSKQTHNSSDTITQFLQERPLNVKILKKTLDYYVFESYLDSVNFKYSDTMRLFKN